MDKPFAPASYASLAIAMALPRPIDPSRETLRPNVSFDFCAASFMFLQPSS